MKYGLLYYKDTDNIGDDVQTYAAERFLPHVDYLIDRENMEIFIPKKEEKVKVIMNAWYLHDKYNFDISPYIEPLHISIFLKKFPYEAGVTLGYDYINENILENYRKNGPVGTRDLHTQKVLNNYNIKNYFSGCLTLTIKKFDNIEKGDYIVAVGLKKEEVSFIKKQTKRKVITVEQNVKRGSFSDESWEKRKERVEELLRLYQGAHLVITTKLHCSLPCLALETPVLLLFDNSFPENKDRIGTYLPYLNHIDREDLYTKKINFEKPRKNPTKYLSIRKKLEKKCNDFVSKEQKQEKLPIIKDYKEYINKSRVMRKAPINQLEKLQKLYEYECKKSSKMYDKIGKLKEENEILNYRYNRYKKIDEFLRKIKNFGSKKNK